MDPFRAIFCNDFSVFCVVSSFHWLLMARSLQGVASSCIAVAGMGMIAKLYDEDQERSQVMGLVMGGIAAGVLIGYPLGGILFDFVSEGFPFALLVMLTSIIWGN